MTTTHRDARDRTGWPSGPWDGEPDKVVWVDDDTDLDCMIVRNLLGAWCGYVGVPPDHPWYLVDYFDLPVRVDVHGGLTFSATCDEDGDLATAICHVPEPGRPDDVWWLGFDTAHGGDLAPGQSVPFPGDVYRDQDYATRETERLARQVAQAAG